MFDFSILQAADPEVAAAVTAELARQRDKIELIASENFTSRAVMAAQGSVLTNKYAEGYPGKAVSVLMLLKSWHANVRKSCLALNLLMFNLIVARRLIWQPILLY